MYPIYDPAESFSGGAVALFGASSQEAVDILMGIFYFKDLVIELIHKANIAATKVVFHQEVGFPSSFVVLAGVGLSCFLSRDALLRTKLELV